MTQFLARLGVVFDSLRFRLTFSAVAALALGMGIVAFALLRQTERDTVAAQRLRQMGETVRMSQILSRRVVDLQRALQLTSGQIDAATLADPQQLLRFMEARPVLDAMFSSVFVTSGKGRLLVLSQGRVLSMPNTDLSDRKYLAQTLADGRPVVSEPITSRVSGEPIVIFTYPLWHEGRVNGALGGSLRLTSRELVADLAEDDDSGALLTIADSKGTILAHPRTDKVLNSIAQEPRLAQAFEAWLAAGAALEPAGLLLPQAGELVSVSGVAGTDWLVWRAASEREVLAPLHAARNRALLLVGALLLGVSTVVFLALNRLLRPLSRLGERAMHLFDADQDPREGWPEARGELGKLTRVLRHVGTERVQLEQRNEQVFMKLNSVMIAAPIGIAFTRNNRFELVSEELCRMLGCSSPGLLGQPLQAVLAEGTEMAPAFEGGQPYVAEHTMRRADGSTLCAQVRGAPVDANQPEAGIIWTFSDVTEQVASRMLLEWSASHDLLTGLANRQVFERRLVHIFDSRPFSIPTAVVAIDLDRFKAINDSHGHAAGDAMLCAVAAAIASTVRASDLVVRTGGDEFALLLENCAAPDAFQIAGAVREAILAIALPWRGQTLRLGASLGTAMLSTETPSVDAWCEEADTACYEMKRTLRSGRAAGAGRATTSGSPEADLGR